MKKKKGEGVNRKKKDKQEGRGTNRKERVLR
jgi:hypothetical protein